MMAMTNAAVCGYKNEPTVSGGQNKSSKAEETDDFGAKFTELVKSIKDSEQEPKTESEISEKLSVTEKEVVDEMPSGEAKEDTSKAAADQYFFIGIPIVYVPTGATENISTENSDTKLSQPIQSMKSNNIQLSDSKSINQTGITVENALANQETKSDNSFDENLKSVSDLKPLVSEKESSQDSQLVKNVNVENQSKQKEGFTDVFENNQSKIESNELSNTTKTTSTQTNQSEVLKAYGSENLNSKDAIKAEVKAEAKTEVKAEVKTEAKVEAKTEAKAEVINQGEQNNSIKEIKAESGKTQNQDKGFSEGFEFKQKESVKKSGETKENNNEVTLNFSQIKPEVNRTSEKTVFDLKTAGNVNVANQVSDQISSVIKEGSSSFKMILNPEGLGEIKIDMTCKDGKVSLEIVASNQTTRQLLQNQSHELKSALGSKNYEVLNLNVVTQTSTGQQANNSFASFGGNGFNNNQQKNQHNFNFNNIIKESGDEKVGFIPSNNNGRLNYTA